MTRGVGRRLPVAARAASTSARTSSSVALTASSQVCARCDRSRFGGRPRDVELGDHGANRFERAARVLDRRLVLVGAGAQRRHGFVGRHAPPAAARRARARRRRAALRRPQSPRAGRRPGARCLELGGERRGALLELRARLPRGAGLRTPAPPARSTSAACAAPASAARRLRSSAASRASNSRRCADGQPLVGRALLVVEPRDRRARFLLAAIERRRAPLPPGGARARAARAFCASRVCLVGGVLQLRVVADDRLFLPVVLGVQRRDRVRRLRDRALELRGFLGQPGQRLAIGADRSRSSLISRFVSRMPRASARRRRTRDADRGTRRRRASRPEAPSAGSPAAAPS